MTITAKQAAKKICELGDWQVSSLRLQKILYFSHMAHLGLYGTPLIDEAFRAWRFGPVIESLHQDFKKFGRDSIKSVFEGVEDIGDESLEASTIRQAWQTFSKDTPLQLSVYTHRKGGAWEKNHVPMSLTGRFSNKSIPDDDIKREFNEYMEPKS